MEANNNNQNNNTNPNNNINNMNSSNNHNSLNGDNGIEISYKTLRTLDARAYQLIDIRNEEAAAYGKIPGAILIPNGDFAEHTEKLPKDKPVILYCTRGIYSGECAQQLREQGIEAYSLVGGYTGWLLESMQAERGQDRERAEEIEKSIRKKFHKVLFSKFAKAINEYDMIQPNDKIAVCISGGKDSMLMAKLFQELKRHNKFPFELVFLVMDPGYSAANRSVIENNAKLMDIPITIFESDIFYAVYDIENSPC